MILYGDCSRYENAVAVSASVATCLAQTGEVPAGSDRHAMLVRAFIRAGELIQGLADAQFERRGVDARSSLQDRGAALLFAMAQEIDRSWRSGFAANISVDALVWQIRDFGKEGWIRTRTAEGYAHYCLYPESYLEAARYSGLGPKTCVIGLRSIGTGLAALVAAALGADPAITLRPVGHPFDREIRAESDVLGIHPTLPGLQFAVVDEGPGLSGSSFVSVAKWLSRLGVTMAQIHFFPSHEGSPGLAASADTRSIWSRCHRHPAVSQTILGGPQGIGHWIESRLGPLNGPLAHYTGGPSMPRDVRFEKLKFLAKTNAGSWLAKFAGLGETGERKLRDAKALERSGFGPKVGGLCYGFLVQKHLAATPLDCVVVGRSRFVEILASYLAFRASGGLGPAGPGASLEELHHMAMENTSELLGDRPARRLNHLLFDLDGSSARRRPVRTDNRLHAGEWLITRTRIVKIDAVDHCEAHDLVGCQDVAWDIAGGIVEHELTVSETAAVRRVVQATGAFVDPQLIDAMILCYLAFQGGLWSTASNSQAKSMADGYVSRLRDRLRRW